MSTNTPEENEHVILVAFQVTAPLRSEAEARLAMALPRPNGLPRGNMPSNPWLESWWVAEDDRRDGSDNDSAVFVKPGMTHLASHLLYANGYSERWNLVSTERSPGRWEQMAPWDG